MRTFLFFLCLLLSQPAFAQPNATTEETTLLLTCDSQGCSRPSTKKLDTSTHIAFTIPKGKMLLEEIRLLRSVERQYNTLYSDKLKLKDEILAWQKIQIAQADKTIQTQQMAIHEINKRVVTLGDENAALRQKLATAQSRKWLFFGVGITIGVGVTVGIVVGVYLIVKVP